MFWPFFMKSLIFMLVAVTVGQIISVLTRSKDEGEE
jgi:hypothetical protein